MPFSEIAPLSVVLAAIGKWVDGLRPGFEV
jgi:hypothetical protein